jgi:hypothetical protein
MVLNDTNAYGGRVHLEAQIAEQMASRGANDAVYLGGCETSNKFEPHEEIVNVTQTDSRDGDDDGTGNALSSSGNASGISGIADDATKISSGA